MVNYNDNVYCLTLEKNHIMLVRHNGTIGWCGNCFREYIAQLMEYDKKFLILGNNNAITYKDVFTYIKANRMWLGYTSNKTMEFQLSDNYDKWNYIKDGKKYGNVPAISWFTNLDNKKRHIDLIRNVLYKKYNEVDYPKYDNYDAININKVANIPVDYFGYMGVPITYIDKHNPNQFEIIGHSLELADMNIIKKEPGKLNGGPRFYVREHGQLCRKFERLSIRNKHPQIL